MRWAPHAWALPLAGCVPFACFVSRAPPLGLKKESYQMIPKQIPPALTFFDPVNGPLVSLL